MNVDPLAKRNASYSSCQDVWKYISELGISKVNIYLLITNSDWQVLIFYRHYNMPAYNNTILLEGVVFTDPLEFAILTSDP